VFTGLAPVVFSLEAIEGLFAAATSYYLDATVWGCFLAILGEALPAS